MKIPKQFIHVVDINFGDLDVTGDIELKGGGKSAEMVMEEPYLTQLKDLIWDTMEKSILRLHSTLVILKDKCKNPFKLRLFREKRFNANRHNLHENT